MRMLRELVRDARARRREQTVVVEGARVIGGAMDRGAEIVTVYAGPDASRTSADEMARRRASGAPGPDVADGVVERLASTVTPQPVIALATLATAGLEDLDPARPRILAVDVADPGH